MTYERKKGCSDIGEKVTCRKSIETKNAVSHVNLRFEIHYEDKNGFVELENTQTKQRQATTMYNLRNFYVLIAIQHIISKDVV